MLCFAWMPASPIIALAYTLQSKLLISNIFRFNN
jgi:hypothetical protein